MKENKKTVLITGASTGIGRAIAIRLAKEGYKVFAGIRKKVDKEEIEGLDKNIQGVYLDVTNSGSIEKAFWYVIKNTDKIDVLINNAGIVEASPVECLDIKRLKEQFEVNTFGALAVAQKFLPLLAGSRIINMSSDASTGLFPYISAYCASKRALDILFNSFYLENKDNIKVISIKPASIKTPIWNKSAKRARDYFDGINEAVRQKYEKDLLILEKNALDNNTKGLEVYTVVDTVVKAIKAKNPKASYNVGFDATLAQWVSKLPIELSNRLIKGRLKI